MSEAGAGEEGGQKIALALALSVVLTLWVALCEPPPREAIGRFLGVVGLSAFLLGWGVRGGWTWLNGGPRWRGVAVVLAGAMALRVAAWMAPVSLSDDVWRYVWDGAIVAGGENPYAETPRERVTRLKGEPDDAAIDAGEVGRASSWAELKRLNSPDYHTVYPPGAQAVFASAEVVARWLGGVSERWLRLFFVVADLLAVLLIMRALIAMRRAVGWATLYGWHPLVVWEVAGGGHTEALAVGLMVALVLMLGRSAPWKIGVVIGLSALAKLTFLIVSPLVGVALWRRGRFRDALIAAVVAVGVLTAGYAPFWFEDLIANQQKSVALYADVFSFDAPLYYAARYLLGYREGVTEPVTHVLSPTLQLATMLAIAVAALWQNGTRERLALAMVVAWGAYLVFNPVLHPWYALGLLAAAALAGAWSVSLAGLGLMLSYLFYVPAVGRPEEILVMVVQSVWAVTMIGWQAGPRAIAWALRRRAKTKFNAVRPYLRPGDRVLDLGAGEGFVGELVAGAGHEVMLAEVDDRNRTELPMVTYDGESLPLDDDQFDVAIIAYTLHHARRPDKVLAETSRVARRLVILETVYEREWDRRLVTFLDHSANRLRGMAPEPLAFDRVEGWLERLNARGMKVLTWRWLGRGVHRHVIIVAERER
ncbi:methyltransferase domain-containing protein [Lujinxingia vulgaris]|uniref:Methyltransferase domain-containing protein n=1 Tax=Lujinxingia vulgaris TaxID=2600176 RepID=A0A5C6X837_9DELT|nr:methyltransferase domain-containing protein [Lujinxingia vulgaris]TXD38031.1 methyltransferase domain-containing protein [Lujinxingia vulgaris]